MLFILTLIIIIILFTISIKKLLHTTYSNMSAEQVVKKVSARILFIRIVRILLIIVLLTAIVSLYAGIIDIRFTYIPLILYTFVQIILFRLYLQASNSSILTILNEECDPYKFGQIQLGYKKYAKRESAINIIKYNLAVSLVNQGSYDDAFHVTNDMTFQKFDPSLLLCYYSVLSICYFQSGNFEMIHKIQKNIQLLRDDTRVKKSKKMKLQISCDRVLRQNIDYFLLEQSGNTEANYALNYALLSEAKCTLVKVNIRLRLAKLDYRTGKIEEAKVHCNYVIQNGNKMYAVTKANELLQAMKV